METITKDSATAGEITQLDKDKEIQAIVQRSPKVISWANALDIRTKDDLEDATHQLSEIANVRGKIEARRKFYTEPLNAILRAINAAAKRLDQPWANADLLARTKAKEWQRAEQRRIEEENARREREARQKREAEEKERREAEEKGAPPPPPPAPEPEPVREEAPAKSVGTGTFKNEWAWELSDPALKREGTDGPVRRSAATKVPDEFWVLDEKKIGKLVKAGTREIPGVRIFEDVGLSIKK